MKGWLENYNDSKVSTPEGFQGEGYDTSGRDYSPAWGGQFEDGGFIPIAQNGIKKKPLYVDSKNDPRYRAYQDSLSLHNRGVKEEKDFKKQVTFSPDSKIIEFPFSKTNSYVNEEDEARVKKSKIKPISAISQGRGKNTKEYRAAVLKYKKPQQEVVVQQPKVEAVNIQPIEQKPIIPNQQIDVRTPAQMPSSFDVSMQRYNMQGPSDYYQVNEEGVDYERAMQIKAASDAYNKDIEKRYGPQNEYRTPKSAADAAERLKQLRSEFEVTPNYQMGGSIPGSVGFTYARTQSPAPSNGPYAKKTKASAQNGETLQYGTPEYKKAYDENRVAYYDKDSDTYINQELAPIEVQGRVRDKGFWEQYVDKIVNENRGASPLEAAIGVPISAVSSLPQLAATYAFTDKMQRPSEAMDIENPYLAMGTDFVLDPLNVTGTGILTKERALARLAASKESGLLSNAYKYNPWAFKPNESNYYRQVSKEAIDDALSSKLIREKGEVVSPENYTKFQNQLEDLAGTKEYLNHEDKYRAMSNNSHGPMPYFQKGELFYGDKPLLKVREKGTPISERRTVKLDHLIESNYSPENFQNSYGYKMSLGNPDEVGSVGILKPDPTLRDLENFNLYKKDWLQGYKQIPKQEDGGVIKDDMGQWAHPGEITEIGSNQITMEGVPYNVLGISDTGDTKLMKPGKNYKFKGKKVTEYPMAKNGLRQEQKGLVNLDQLTNFTNYNTKQPGGWLESYK